MRRQPFNDWENLLRSLLGDAKREEFQSQSFGHLGDAGRHGTLVAPLQRGLIWEDAPQSVKGVGHSIMFDDRLVNVEIALKRAMDRLDPKRHDTARLAVLAGFIPVSPSGRTACAAKKHEFSRRRFHDKNPNKNCIDTIGIGG